MPTYTFMRHGAAPRSMKAASCNTAGCRSVPGAEAPDNSFMIKDPPREVKDIGLAGLKDTPREASGTAADGLKAPPREAPEYGPGGLKASPTRGSGVRPWLAEGHGPERLGVSALPA
ncbi:MAG: hypothetical protein LBT40_05295 [Deltaproteobacteria bacterium]|nr:hypothetical protein [Deltaproteobacteria bacterium]